MSSKSKRFKKDSKPIDSGNFMISNTQLYDDDTVVYFIIIFTPQIFTLIIISN